MPESFVCFDCIREDYLSDLTKKQDNYDKCSYCDEMRFCINLRDLAEAIHIGIQEHFSLTPNEPTPFEYALQNDKDFNYFWYRDGQEINDLIQEIVGVDTKLAHDIQDCLSNIYDNDEDIMCGAPELYGDSYYIESSSDIQHAYEKWIALSQEVKHKSRFFNPIVKKTLDEMFEDVHNYETSNRNHIVKYLTPNDKNSVFYRVRTVHSEKELEEILTNPVSELGPPPSNIACAGRMNPAGISVFYGAFDPDTCIAEVRPTVGSYAVLGKFSVVRKLRVIDLEMLTKVVVTGSYFDPKYTSRRKKAALLKSIVSQLTSPIVANEHFEYLPTQMIAEYLAEIIEPRLDGIIFKSSQASNEGRNIVLFNHACSVEPYESLYQTKISVDFGNNTISEDYDDTITVFENRLDNEETFDSNSTASNKHYLNETQNGFFNINEASLRLDVHSIKVVFINGVQYSTVNRRTNRLISDTSNYFQTTEF